MSLVDIAEFCCEGKRNRTWSGDTYKEFCRILQTVQIEEEDTECLI